MDDTERELCSIRKGYNPYMPGDCRHEVVNRYLYKKMMLLQDLMNELFFSEKKDDNI